MRSLPLFAALAMLALLAPGAEAAGSGVKLTGPADAIKADGPASATVKIALTLEGVTCVGVGDVPVNLKIIETKGLRSAELTWSSVLFRIAPTSASAQPWTGTSEVGVRVWGQDPVGATTVLATWALPSNCVSKGATSGEARYTLRVDGPEPAPEVQLPPPEAPPLTQRNQEVAYAQESKEMTQPVVSLPVPVLGAIAGMCIGGAIVFYKRMRAAAPFA